MLNSRLHRGFLILLAIALPETGSAKDDETAKIRGEIVRVGKAITKNRALIRDSEVQIKEIESGRRDEAYRGDCSCSFAASACGFEEWKPVVIKAGEVDAEVHDSVIKEFLEKNIKDEPCLYLHRNVVSKRSKIKNTQLSTSCRKAVSKCGEVTKAEDLELHRDQVANSTSEITSLEATQSDLQRELAALLTTDASIEAVKRLEENVKELKQVVEAQRREIEELKRRPAGNEKDLPLDSPVRNQGNGPKPPENRLPLQFGNGPASGTEQGK